MPIMSTKYFWRLHENFPVTLMALELAVREQKEVGDWAKSWAVLCQAKVRRSIAREKSALLVILGNLESAGGLVLAIESNV